jgi:hypothetical protein
VSIIYDALQKTQRARTENRDYKPDRFTLFRNILNAAVKIAVVLTAFCIIYIYSPMVTKHFSFKHTHKVAAVPQVQQQSEPVAVAASVPVTQQGLVLTGVMLAGADSVAIINNHSYQLGDVVDGMKLIGIELNKVQLLNGNQIIVLRSEG